MNYIRARGQLAADLVLADARVINVFTARSSMVMSPFTRFDAGVGATQRQNKLWNYRGILAPGLIDGHTHLESSMLDVINMPVPCSPEEP